MSVHTSIDTPQAWVVANRAYLDKELDRLRLLLHRRIRWLQTRWGSDARQGYQGLMISDGEVDRLLSASRSEETDFYQRDKEARKISLALGTLGREIEAQGRLLSDAGTPAALEVLVRLFGLSPFERDVLLLCAAPELDPAFERLYAYVQDDATRKYTTPHLALTLFEGQGEGWIRAKESLMPHGVLRRFRLVTLDPGPLPSLAPAASPLRLTERIANYMMGVNQIDERVAGLLRPMPPALLAPDQRDIMNRLQNRIEAGAKQGPWPPINLVGPPEAGKEALARMFCERIGLHPYEFGVAGLPPADPERHETLRVLEREAVLSQFALYLNTERINSTTQADLASSLGDVVERLSVFLIVGSQERWQTDRRMITVQLAKPDATGQRAMWQQALAQIANSLNGEVEALVQQFEFGPTAIVRTISTAQDRACLRTSDENPEVKQEDLWQACRDQAGTHLDELGQRIIPCHTWDDIILPEDVLAQLREIAAQVSHRPQVYEVWGFGAKLNRGRGISALFAGPSGTGKTMAAEILASHLSLDLFRIDLSGVVSKYIGETEKNLRRVFDAAEQGGAILFFDEADALFGKRSEVKDSHDRYANIEINYLLQRMEDYRGLAILATNKKSFLDQAFMRRLRFLVDFPFPDLEHRTQIWQRVFPAPAAVDQLDHAALSRMEISGGNIRNIALNAAFLAASEGCAIRMGHVFQSARREYARLDKLVSESEFGTYYVAKKRK